MGRGNVDNRHGDSLRLYLMASRSLLSSCTLTRLSFFIDFFWDSPSLHFTDNLYVFLHLRALLFLSFTSSLAISHGILIAHNATTVEHLSIQSMRRKENNLLSGAFDFFQFKFVFLPLFNFRYHGLISSGATGRNSRNGENGTPNGGG